MTTDTPFAQRTTCLLFGNDPVSGLPTEEDLTNFLGCSNYERDAIGDDDDDDDKTLEGIKAIYRGFMTAQACKSGDPDRDAIDAGFPEMAVWVAYHVPVSLPLLIKFSQGLICALRLLPGDIDKLEQLNDRLSAATSVIDRFEFAVSSFLRHPKDLREAGLYDPAVFKTDWTDLVTLKKTYGKQAQNDAAQDLIRFFDERVWEADPEPLHPLPIEQFFDEE